MTGAYLRQLTVDEIAGTLSTNNSTTSNLGNGGVYTGTWEEIVDFASIRISVYADQASATSGLSIQQSPDQSILFEDTYSIAAGDKKLYSINPIARYFRIVYTNGATPQTAFSIQTIYNSVYTKPTSHRLGDTVTAEDDTELVKSVIAYRDENDDEYNNVGIQNPFPVDGDSVYAKDIWVAQSSIGGFSGAITDLFDNLHSVITDSSATNPKEIIIHFNRTIVNNVVGLGAYSGNFSNTLIQIGNSGGVYTTVIDESADATTYTSRTFQLPSTYGYNSLKIQFHTANTITLSNCVILKTRSTVSRLQGVRDDGTVNDVVISNSNRLRTVSQPYTYAIAEGDIENHDPLIKFGTRTSVAANTQSTCWEGPTALYAYMSSAQQLKVSSTSAQDSAAGTGIRTLYIEGLDSNYDEINETITMAGLAVVTTVNSYLRVYRAYGVTCGTSYTNVGTISILNNAATVTQAIINIGDGQTLMSLWTVPNGKTAYIVRGGLSTDSNKGARVSLFARQLDGGTLYPWLIKYRGYIFSGGEEISFAIPYVLPEKTDIEVRVLTPASAGTTSLGSTFELWYEDTV